MGGACSAHRGMRCEYKIFIRQPVRKGPLGILRRRCEDNIEMYLRALGSEGVECINLARDSDW